YKSWDRNWRRPHPPEQCDLWTASSTLPGHGLRCQWPPAAWLFCFPPKPSRIPSTASKQLEKSSISGICFSSRLLRSALLTALCASRAHSPHPSHPTESLFAATPLLSLASIIAAIARYGIPNCGPWL
ncbi:hypothetical protein B0H14DRAFT_2817659, partial [Mycena olivaceomarginata]